MQGMKLSMRPYLQAIINSFTHRLDLEMPGPANFRKVDLVKAAIAKGTLDIETIDRRVKAVLKLLARTGKFQKPSITAEQAIDLPEHSAIIRKAGAESMVLLKNSNNILPLQIDRLDSIAMLGLAKHCLAHGGGSAAVNAHHRISPWEAFETTLGGKVEMKYAEGWLVPVLLYLFNDLTITRSADPANSACTLKGRL